MGLNIAIDTNKYRDFVEGDPGTLEIFQRAERIHVPLIVIAELRAGFAAGRYRDENEAVLETFLHRPRVRALLPDLDTTRHYAELYQRLRRAGTPIPVNDLWIASLVLQHDLILYTRDTHFHSIAYLPKL
jgi:tRNA(fMet)-specific endonuclease VapC